MEIKDRVCCQIDAENCRFRKPFKVRKCTYWKGTKFDISECLYCEPECPSEILEESSKIDCMDVALVTTGVALGAALMILIMVMV